MTALRIVLLSAVTASAQAEEARPDVGASLKLLRWTEDYAWLDGVPPSDREGLERIKAVPLSSGGPVLTVGGNYRLRSEGFANPAFDLRGTENFVSLGQRVLVHADVGFGKGARVFGELGWFEEDGREPFARPFDESAPDVTQLFMDVGAPSDLRLRLGRQEMPLGSTRLYGLREGPNVRRVFDAARLDGTVGDVSATGFYARPVLTAGGPFDDESRAVEQTWGVLATWDVAQADASFEPYYFGRRLEAQTWNGVTAEERRHTLGLRAFATVGRLDYDVEAAYQFGTFGRDDIRAWGVASLVGYTFADMRWQPRIGARLNVASGDRGTTGRLGTFDALYPNLSYFTEAAVYAPSNAVDFRPFVEMSPIDAVSLTFGADAILRLRETDAVYGAGYVPLVPAGRGGTGLAAVLVDASVVWRVSPFVEVKAVYVHGAAGPVVRDAGGGDLDFALLQLSTRF